MKLQVLYSCVEISSFARKLRGQLGCEGQER